MRSLLLLCALVPLCPPRTGSSFLSSGEDMCYFWLYGKEPYAKGFQCNEWRDGTEVKICCGTCSPPCCCSSEGSLIDHHWCPAESKPSVKTVEVYISPFTKIMEHWMIFLSVSCGVILAFAVSLCLYFQFKRYLIRRRIRKLKAERRHQIALCRQRKRSDDIPGFDKFLSDNAGHKVAGQDAAVGGNAGKDSAVHGDAGKDAAVCGDAGKDSAVRGDAGKDAAVGGNAVCEDAGLIGAVGGDPNYQDAGLIGAVGGDPIYEDVGRDAAIPEDALYEDAFHDGAVRRKRALRRQRSVFDIPCSVDAVQDDAILEDASKEDAFQDSAACRRRALRRQRSVFDPPYSNVAVRYDPILEEVSQEDAFQDSAACRRRALRHQQSVFDSPYTNVPVQYAPILEEASQEDAYYESAARRRRRQRSAYNTPYTNDAVQYDSILEDDVDDDTFYDGAERFKQALRRQQSVFDTPYTINAVQGDAVRKDAACDHSVCLTHAVCHQQKGSDAPGTNAATRDKIVPKKSVSFSGVGVSQGIQPAAHLSGPAVRFHHGSLEDKVTIVPPATEEPPPFKITVARDYNP